MPDGILQRARCVIGVALTWGALWALIFASISVVAGIIEPEVIDEGEGPIRVGAIGAGIGVVSGLAFCFALWVAERGRTFRDMALGRVALWGMLASAVVPLSTGRHDQVLVLCPIGALVAVGTIALARRLAADPPRSVP